MLYLPLCSYKIKHLMFLLFKHTLLIRPKLKENISYSIPKNNIRINISEPRLVEAIFGSICEARLKVNKQWSQKKPQ